jgi:hypothetical protein
MPKTNIRQIRIDGNIAYIPTSSGHEAVMDASSLHLVSMYNWYALTSHRSDGSLRTVYLKTNVKCDGKLKTIYLHRLISGAPDGMDIDHIDGDGLNNRASNLRVTTHSQNMQNQRLGIRNTSGVKGVSWNKNARRWVARIKFNGKNKYIGLYDTLDLGRIAYADASRQLYGEYSRL